MAWGTAWTTSTIMRTVKNRFARDPRSGKIIALWLNGHFSCPLPSPRQVFETIFIPRAEPPNLSKKPRTLYPGCISTHPSARSNADPPIDLKILTFSICGFHGKVHSPSRCTQRTLVYRGPLRLHRQTARRSSPNHPSWRFGIFASRGPRRSRRQRPFLPSRSRRVCGSPLFHPATRRARRQNRSPW